MKNLRLGAVLRALSNWCYSFPKIEKQRLEHGVPYFSPLLSWIMPKNILIHEVVFGNLKLEETSWHKSSFLAVCLRVLQVANPQAKNRVSQPCVQKVV